MRAMLPAGISRLSGTVRSAKQRSVQFPIRIGWLIAVMAAPLPLLAGCGGADRSERNNTAVVGGSDQGGGANASAGAGLPRGAGGTYNGVGGSGASGNSAGGLPSSVGGNSAGGQSTSAGGNSAGGQSTSAGGTTVPVQACNVQGCPSGYVCNASGKCSGGNPVGLAFDEKTISVGGTVTLNGGPITDCTALNGIGSLQFTETTTGVVLSAGLVCSNGTGAATFSTKMIPGTYKVTVGNNPLAGLVFGYQLANNLALPASNTSLAFDEKTISVGGTVTLNGGPITDCTALNGIGSLQFTETTTGVVLSAGLVCSNGTGAATFSTKMIPGTYKVTVGNNPLAGLVFGYVLVDQLLLP
jgi:hypothetical protein